jgi:seryl-tRNA synthetase
LALDQQLLELEGSRSQLQARSNEIGKAVGQKIQQGADPKGPEVAKLREAGNQLKQQIADLEAPEREIRAQLDAILMTLPNLPADSTPQGKDETENLQARRLMDHCRGTGFVA